MRHWLKHNGERVWRRHACGRSVRRENNPPDCFLVPLTRGRSHAAAAFKRREGAVGPHIEDDRHRREPWAGRNRAVAAAARPRPAAGAGRGVHIGPLLDDGGFRARQLGRDSRDRKGLVTGKMLSLKKISHWTAAYARLSWNRHGSGGRGPGWAAGRGLWNPRRYSKALTPRKTGLARLGESVFPRCRPAGTGVWGGEGRPSAASVAEVSSGPGRPRRRRVPVEPSW